MRYQCGTCGKMFDSIEDCRRCEALHASSSVRVELRCYDDGRWSFSVLDATDEELRSWREDACSVYYLDTLGWTKYIRKGDDLEAARRWLVDKARSDLSGKLDGLTGLRAALDECREMLVRDGVLGAYGEPVAGYRPWGVFE